MYLYVFDRRTKVGTNNDEAQAKAFVLDKYSEEYSKLVTENTRASWNYDTNLTDHNAAVLVDIFIQLRTCFILHIHALYTCTIVYMYVVWVLFAGRSQRSPVSIRRRSKQPSVFV